MLELATNEYMLSLLALLFGILVGLERYSHRQAIGFRTMGMAGLLGCALGVLSFRLSPLHTMSVGRLVGQLIVGVGFIGMGIIIKGSRNKVLGLTTALGLLGIIIVGAIIGFGFPLYGSFVGFAVYVLFATRSLEFKLYESSKNLTYKTLERGIINGIKKIKEANNKKTTEKEKKKNR